MSGTDYSGTYAAFINCPSVSGEASINISEIAAYEGDHVTIVTLKSGKHVSCRVTKEEFDKGLRQAHDVLAKARP